MTETRNPKPRTRNPKPKPMHDQIFAPNPTIQKTYIASHQPCSPNFKTFARP